MSAETMQWLNQNCLIGYTNSRNPGAWLKDIGDGQIGAWHYRASDQGDKPNHYPDAIPVEEVLERLFHWDALEGSIEATAIHSEGVTVTRDSIRKAIMRGDTGAIMGIFKAGYAIHQYRVWLVENVALLLDADLGIGGAGLLRGGAQAYVTVQVPDTIVTPSGVAFRPSLMACTSHDGSLATTYLRHAENVVCDNSMSAALQGAHNKVKVRHSGNTKLKLIDAREALELVHTTGDDFAQQVEMLTNVSVSEGDWEKFLDTLVPLTDKNGALKEGASATNALNKRNKYARLYNNDNRVTPWRGTAWGLLQAANTYAHHEAGADNGKRAERNMQRAITGGVDKLDAETFEVIKQVCNI